MKKLFNLVSALLLSAALLCSMGSAAWADSTVSYKGKDGKFDIQSDDDLFDSFKNVMPGDKLTETITIKNEDLKADYVLIYLQAVPHQELIGPHVDEVKANEDYASMMDFLSQMKLTVTAGDGTVLSSDSSDKPAGLAEPCLIARLERRGSTELDVTLEVPITMENEYALRLGEVDWLFIAEEMYGPKTGDDNGILLSAAGLCLSLMGLAAILAYRRKTA